MHIVEKHFLSLSTFSIMGSVTLCDIMPCQNPFGLDANLTKNTYVEFVLKKNGGNLRNLVSVQDIHEANIQIFPQNH